MPPSGNTPNLFAQLTPWDELRVSLLGRRVEVFQPDAKPEQWRRGLVASQGLDPDAKPDAKKDTTVGAASAAPDDDPSAKVGWLIAFDGGEVQWVRFVRGTPLVRFLGDESVLYPAERGVVGGQAAPRAPTEDFLGSPTAAALGYGFVNESSSSSLRSKGTDHEKSRDVPRFRAETVTNNKLAIRSTKINPPPMPHAFLMKV